MERITLRRKVAHTVLLQIAVLREIYRVFVRQVKLSLFYQRFKVITQFSEKNYQPKPRPKVFVSIAHIASVEEFRDREKATPKIEKLKNTIDALLNSFAHCELTLVVSTLPKRHVTAYLPDYQLQCIQVQEEPDYDPMFVGFRIQDEFIQKVDEFDWFLFVEDDIIIYDSLVLEKLEKFNQQSGYDRAILLPNRYEMWQGTKRYIDLTIELELAWNQFSAVEIEGVKFAECTNPHSGFYCLSQKQLKQWMASGRFWKDRVIQVGPLESAATFSLLECFSIYKPHPANLNFFEVRHYDTKYSQLYPHPDSPYTLSAIQTESRSNPVSSPVGEA